MMYVIFGLLGAIFGSFVGAQVWRLRARQLKEDQQAGEKVDKKEMKRLSHLLGKGVKNDRSCCLHCSHVLAWYDLIPLVSWISLGGRCRYCRKFIGWTEILLEAGLAVLFVVSFAFWPGGLVDIWQWILLALWLVGLALLAILFVYDIKWMLLPDIINIPFIVIGVLFASIKMFLAVNFNEALMSLLGSLAILSGIYASLYLFSRMKYGEDGTWIGFGDVKLGLGLALFLGDWLMAFLALFAANLIGTLLVLPSMLRGKLKGSSRISFGPLLIVGFLVAWFFGQKIASWLMLTYVI